MSQSTRNETSHQESLVCIDLTWSEEDSSHSSSSSGIITLFVCEEEVKVIDQNTSKNTFATAAITATTSTTTTTATSNTIWKHSFFSFPPSFISFLPDHNETAIITPHILQDIIHVKIQRREIHGNSSEPYHEKKQIRSHSLRTIIGPTTSLHSSSHSSSHAQCPTYCHSHPCPYRYLVHVQQKDNFSCGFRNLQMILSALVGHLHPHHFFFSQLSSLLYNTSSVPPSSVQHVQQREPKPMVFTLPTLLQLQFLLEESWKHGFDPTGALHYQYHIYQTQAKIGAVEVASLLSFLFIECMIVQFMTCEESRSFLGPFLWCYFDSHSFPFPCTREENDFYKTIQYLFEQAERFQTVESLLSHPHPPFQPHEHQHESSPILPVYLQWEGHSVTVIGIERISNNCNNNNNSNNNKMPTYDYNLLILDPYKNGQEYTHLTTSSIPSSKQYIPSPTSQFQNKEEEETSIAYDRQIQKLRFPINQLKGKDIQLVCCTNQNYKDNHWNRNTNHETNSFLSTKESSLSSGTWNHELRERTKKCENVVTARHDIVKMKLQALENTRKRRENKRKAY